MGRTAQTSSVSRQGFGRLAREGTRIRAEDLIANAVDFTPEQIVAEIFVVTVPETAWARLTNSELLAAVDQAGFDVMVTSDQSVTDQDSVASQRLAFMELSTTQ